MQETLLLEGSRVRASKMRRAIVNYVFNSSFKARGIVRLLSTTDVDQVQCIFCAACFTVRCWSNSIVLRRGVKQKTTGT